MGSRGWESAAGRDGGGEPLFVFSFPFLSSRWDSADIFNVMQMNDRRSKNGLRM